MPDDYRPTQPGDAFEATVQLPPDDYDVPPEPLPEMPPAEQGPRRSSLVWVGIVVVVFMAVPLLASLSTRTAPRAKAPAASEPVAAVEPDAASPAAAPAERSAPAAPIPDRPAPMPARALADPQRQVVTKCIDRGRVVYTQTGECTGSMTAVPIDTSKNVVGPGRDGTRQ